MIVLAVPVQRGDEVVVPRHVDRVIALDVIETGHKRAVVDLQRGDVRIGPAQRVRHGPAIHVLRVAEVTEAIGCRLRLQEESGARRRVIGTEVRRKERIVAAAGQRLRLLSGPRGVQVDGDQDEHQCPNERVEKGPAGHLQGSQRRRGEDRRRQVEDDQSPLRRAGVNALEAGQPPHQRVQRRWLGAREHKHRYTEQGEVRHAAAAPRDEWCGDGQRQSRPTDVREAGLQQQPLPAVDDAPVGPRGKQRNAGARVSARQVRHQVVLQSRQKAGRGESQAEQQHASQVTSKAANPRRGCAHCRQERAVAEIATQNQRGVVRALSDPGAQNLAQRQACHTPPRGLHAPASAPDCSFGAKQHEW